MFHYPALGIVRHFSGKVSRTYFSELYLKAVFGRSSVPKRPEKSFWGNTLSTDKRNFSLIDIYQISDHSSDDSSCLDDNPTKKSVIETRTLDRPGRLYDADEQCQLSYGQTSKFCGGGKFLDVSFAIYHFQHSSQKTD